MKGNDKHVLIRLCFDTITETYVKLGQYVLIRQTLFPLVRSGHPLPPLANLTYLNENWSLQYYICQVRPF